MEGGGGNVSPPHGHSTNTVSQTSSPPPSQFIHTHIGMRCYLGRMICHIAHFLCHSVFLAPGPGVLGDVRAVVRAGAACACPLLQQQRPGPRLHRARGADAHRRLGGRAGERVAPDAVGGAVSVAKFRLLNPSLGTQVFRRFFYISLCAKSRHVTQPSREEESRYTTHKATLLQKWLFRCSCQGLPGLPGLPRLQRLQRPLRPLFQGILLPREK